jgi:hypothetical protein
LLFPFCRRAAGDWIGDDALVGTALPPTSPAARDGAARRLACAEMPVDTPIGC